MKRGVWLLLLVAIAACAAPEVTERYRAERAFFRVDRPFVALKRAGEPLTTGEYRVYASTWEAVASGIGEDPDPRIREMRGRAWLRAAECHFALVDSVRAELILANTADNFSDFPRIFGEASLGLGRVDEHHGHYRGAIHHYRNVVEQVEPDPGPDPRSPPNPDDPPEEQTADDFVLGLPLHMARLAARDTTVTDPGRFYEEAVNYYRDRLDDPSPFVRIEATMLLGEVLADRGRWLEASRTVDAIEGRIPGLVLSRIENADARLASVSYQIQALEFGEADRDSVGRLVERLVEDYRYGDYAPAALFAFARCMYRFGEDEQVHAYVSRLVRDYPTAPVVPEAQLLRAQVFAREGNWRDARRTLQSLPLEYPTSEAALRAPLEIAAHHRRAGDTESERSALLRAERQYREILERYPVGPHSYATHEKLVTAYDLQGRSGEALDELLAMCEGVARPTQRPGLLMAAARRAEFQLGEPARAIQLYQKLADEFPDTRVGRAAVRDVHRLARAQGE